MTGQSVNFAEFIWMHPARALSACIYGLLLCVPVCGLERDRSIAQFHHTAWTARDGAPSQISAFAQTEDGYLWIGSGRGLFRFDGVQFESYVPPAGVTLPSHNIYALMATPDGGLWVSFRPSGLGFLKDGRMSVFTRPDELPQSQVYCFARDLDGRVWAGTHTGLALLDGSRWLEIGAAWNLTNQRIWSMFVDRDGTLWVAADDTIVFLRRGSKVFQQAGMRLGGVPMIGQASDGRLWFTEYSRYLRTLTPSGRDPSADEPEIRVHAYKFLFDREGSLWLSSGAEGIRRVRFPERLGNRKLEARDPELESFKVQDGLTDNTADNLFEDREGNIWISTNKGLDRFRHSHLIPVALPPGYRDLTLLAGDKGDVWAGSSDSNPLLRISGENIVPKSIAMKIASVYRDANDVVWWGGKGGIWRQRDERFDFFPQPNGVSFDSLDWLWEVIPNYLDGGLWVGLGDVGLIRFEDGNWTNRPKPHGLLDRVPSASYRDPGGRVWLGYTANRVSVLDGERVRSYTHDDGIDIGRIRAIRGRGPQFWFGGETGLAIFSNGRFRTIRTAAGEPLGTVSGIVETRDGALWLNELHGIVHISAEEVRRVIENPEYLVTYQLFDFQDGLPGAPQMSFTVSTALEAADGRLWFATDNGLASIDPSRILKNRTPPPVSIRSLSTDTKTYEPSPLLHLPRGTQSLRIDYTALSLSIPGRVRFRYKLEGVDDVWQYADTRRQAFYNNLRPGNYRFRVIACNHDGLWNEGGATLLFNIAPAFYQTTVFFLFCLTVAGCLVWIAFRWRIHQLKSRLHLQFNERLSERTRIAQELHDTLLQGVFSASIQLDAVVEQLTENSHVKPRLSRVQQLMKHVMEEGRNTVRGLHSPHADDSLRLENAFAKIRQDLDVCEQIDFRIIVEGSPRPLHPVVRDEIYRIGREALTNAFRHSGASLIEVEMEYAAKYFKIIVRDNGCGINTDILRSGREGHLGLSGMRRRAEKMGAKLQVRSRVGAGTEIELSTPAHVAFENHSDGNWLKRLKNLYSRKAKI